METENHETSCNGTDSSQNDLGLLLRQAREIRNLSVVNLARSLRLSPRVIEHLENNRFDELPGPVFVKGYIRSVAKEMEIDSTPLISIFDRQTQNREPSINDFASKPSVQISTDNNLIRYTTIALCLTMLLMVGLWWKTNDTPLPRFIDNLASDPDLQQEPPLTKDSKTEQESIPATQEPELMPKQVIHPEGPFYPETVRDEPLLKMDTDTNPVTGPIPLRTFGHPDIEISTHSESWIEIMDATDETLYYDLAKSNALIQIDGVRPYRLLIGNSSSETITLKFDGELVDVGPLSKRAIARFQLPLVND